MPLFQKQFIGQFFQGRQSQSVLNGLTKTGMLMVNCFRVSHGGTPVCTMGEM